MEPEKLSIGTENLSADGGTVTPGQHAPVVKLTGPEVVRMLEAFARIPAVALVEVDALVIVQGVGGRGLVRSTGGRLFLTLLPASSHAAVERSAAQIVAELSLGRARVAGAGAGAAEKEGEASSDGRAGVSAGDSENLSAVAAASGAESGEGAAESAPAPARQWRGAVLPILAGGLLIFTVIFSLLERSSDSGIDRVRDPAAIAQHRARHDGRYGDAAAGQTTLVLKDGLLTGYQRPGGAKLFQSDYGFGTKPGGEVVVLVLENGAVLEPQAGGSLRFLGQVYPRQR